MKSLLQPSKKPHFALVLSGECSKSISLLLCRIVGDGKYTVGDTRILGRFNGSLRDKQLVIIEQTNELRLEHLAKLKEIVSSPTIIIEDRWQNPERFQSLHHVVLLTPPVNDLARRFVNIDCSPTDGLLNLLDHENTKRLVEYLT